MRPAGGCCRQSTVKGKVGRQAKLLTRDEARRIAANIAKAARADAEAVIRSVELIVQPDAHDVVGCCAIASPEAIVQANTNDVEAVVKGDIKRRRASSGCSPGGC